MAKAGADLIEIGVPFSDPVAEGTVIQAASKKALDAGTTTDKIFDMAKKASAQVNIPLVIMTYVNPIFVYGKEKFFAKCKECGICGVIVPDLPYEEKDEILSQANDCNVEVVSLIAPTSENRIGMIASEAQGFVYCVSSLGVTGMRSEIKTNVKDIVDTIRQYTDIPVAVGFGISTPQQAHDMAKISDGAIVGSAIIHGENIRRRHRRQCHYPYRRQIRQRRRAVSIRLCKIYERSYLKSIKNKAITIFSVIAFIF